MDMDRSMSLGITNIPCDIEGVISTLRLTAYQIKLQMEGGREVTLWKRRFNTQWGGGKAFESSFYQQLCEAQGDSLVPVLAPGVKVFLSLDPSHNAGRTAQIHCVVSMSTPSSKDTRRMRVYSSAVASWASKVSKEVVLLQQHSLVPETIKTLLQQGGLFVVGSSDAEIDMSTDWDDCVDASAPRTAMCIARSILVILGTAVHRVNIRATLESDAKHVPGGVAASELDSLAGVVYSYTRFRQNPFEVPMAGGGGKRPLFKTLDGFATAYGFSESMRRVAAVVYKLQMLKADGGHSCYPVQSLVASPLLHWTAADVGMAISEGVRSGCLRQDGLGDKDVYLALTYAVESRVALRIASLCKGGMVMSWAKRVGSAAYREKVQEMLRGADADIACTKLDDIQREAVSASLTSAKDLLVLSGYPGTGKSRVSQAVQKICTALGLKVIVCAPTAKAASRLGDGAMTVHRALGAQPSGSGFKFTHNDLNPIDADLVLVDEVSMMDMTLTAALLGACGSQRTRLVMVGDANQLPSVEWGSVLAALMETACVPKVFLEHIYRQQQDTSSPSSQLNTIWPLARSVAEGGPLLRADLQSSTVTWSTDDSLAGVSRALLALKAEHGDKLQIISPSRKHGLHTVLLNEIILDRVIGRWDTRFEVGDRVVVTKNQPIKGLAGMTNKTPPMNGDCGCVTGQKVVSPSEGRTIMVRLDDDRMGSIPPSDLDHAYALTTHKAQGSEYDVVALVLSNQHGKALNRQALYTSVSRAVKRLFIFASRETLGTCVNTLSEHRHGHLSARIVWCNNSFEN